MRFQVDWVSLIVGGKFTVFALFYFVFGVIFQVQAPGGACIWRGYLTEGFLRYRFGGLIFGGAYTWRGFFLEFYGMPYTQLRQCQFELKRIQDEARSTNLKITILIEIRVYEKFISVCCLKI